MNKVKLSQERIQEELDLLPGWSYKDQSLHKEFVFRTFVEAFGFMASVALVAERMDHHPNWSNVYNRVQIALNTHESNGVTELDFALAKEMEHLARN